MKLALVIVVALTITGCARQRIGLELYDPDTYSRADVDAITATAACKAQARTPVQIARCEVRR